MNPPPKTEFPSTSSSSTSSSVLLNTSGGAVKRDMTGFASLLNLKDGNCTATRARRIQISQMGASSRASSDGGLGPGLKKRWSFHSSNQINELLKEDRVMKPIISPKRRKPNSGTTLTRSNSETCKYSATLHPRGHRKLLDQSASSKLVLTNHQQLQSKPHQKTKVIAMSGECSTSDSKSRQRLMDEYYSFMDPYPASYYKFCVQPKPSKYSREPPPPDRISSMPDEVLLRICKFLPKPALSNLGRTSRRFSGLIEDDTLWKRLCVMNKILSPEHLIIISSRKPMYLRMARTTIPDPDVLPNDLTELTSSSQLRFLDLSSATISPFALSIIMKISPKLIKLSLEHLIVTKEVVQSMMGFVGSIEVLNLTMCYDVDAKTLMEFLSNCQVLKELNMSCLRCDWSKEDLTSIISKLPGTLQQLNISGYRNTLDDTHVAMIASRCPKLLELDVSDSQEMSGKSIEHILKLKNLQHLGLSRCYGVDPPYYSHLSCCKHLKYLDLFSLFKETSIRQLSSTLPGIEINKYLFSAVARPTVGNKRSSIWLQRVRD
ncbi:S-phase kinase-associated protein 2 [Orchesella cincta]|uniref:S-phase kinase-associated protein 2 n=1 Tax=Orchesella cincta TaxID=48709 RepID=A0A1D2MMF3_ORCCI|nr:S-phase kinase-associated protein 2 [Orchesella cincta]